MSPRCWFGRHELGGLVGRGAVLSVRCTRCDQISRGVVIDGPPPRVTQPKAKRSRIFWLRGIYSKQGA